METNASPGVVNPLPVSVQANEKKRLILDLRYVNKFLRKRHVKHKDWKTAMSYFARGAYMFSFAIKSGYHQVEIFEDHLTYLGLSWKDRSNHVKFYVFTVLPFGYRPSLTCSPKFLSLSRNIEDTLGHLHCCFS